jgi:hypothetical protein
MAQAAVSFGLSPEPGPCSSVGCFRRADHLPSRRTGARGVIRAGRGVKPRFNSTHSDEAHSYHTLRNTARAYAGVWSRWRSWLLARAEARVFRSCCSSPREEVTVEG